MNKACALLPETMFYTTYAISTIHRAGCRLITMRRPLQLLLACYCLLALPVSSAASASSPGSVIKVTDSARAYKKKDVSKTVRRSNILMLFALSHVSLPSSLRSQILARILKCPV